MNILSAITDPNSEAALRSILEPAGHLLVHCRSLATAPGIFPPSVAGAFFLDCQNVNTTVVANVSELSSAGYETIYVLAREKNTEWEERVMLAGAKHVFSFPLRADLILKLLQRDEAISPRDHPGPGPTIIPTAPHNPSRGAPFAEMRALHRLMRATGGPHDNLDPFFDRLRQMLGLNRAALFLAPDNGDTMRCRYAAGLARELSESYPLSMLRGIGLLTQRFNLAYSPTTLPNSPTGNEARQELSTLGMHWAIPVADADNFHGVLMVGARATGSSLGEDEIELLFLLMEELASVMQDKIVIERLRAGK